MKNTNREYDAIGVITKLILFTIIFLGGYFIGTQNEREPEIVEKVVKVRVTEEEKPEAKAPDTNETIAPIEIVDKETLCRYAKAYRYLYWYFNIDGLHRRPGETRADFDELGELLGVSDELNTLVCPIQ